MDEIIEKLKNEYNINYEKAENYHSDVYKRYHYGICDGIYLALDIIKESIKKEGE